VLYYGKTMWASHKSKMWENIRVMTNTLSQTKELLLSLIHKQKSAFRVQLACAPVLNSHMNTQVTLFSRNL
jgi:hypothetical protein